MGKDDLEQVDGRDQRSYGFSSFDLSAGTNRECLVPTEAKIAMSPGRADQSTGNVTDDWRAGFVTRWQRKCERFSDGVRGVVRYGVGVPVLGVGRSGLSENWGSWTAYACRANKGGNDMSWTLVVVGSDVRR